MRLWIRVSFVFLSLLLGLTASLESAKASSPAEPTLELEYKNLPDYFVVGKTYKLEVESLSIGGEVKKAEFAFDSDSDEVVENVETVLTDNGKHFTTTGDFTPKKKGKHTLTFTMEVEGNGSYYIDSKTAKIRVLNDGDIFVPGDPVAVDIKMTTSTSKFEVGKQIKISVTTPKKGTTYDQVRFELLSPYKDEKVEGVKTVASRSTYTTTGYLTPQHEGEYRIHFRMTMSDDQGKEWEATASKTVKVKKVEPKKIKVLFVPLAATPRLQYGGEAVVIAKFPTYYAKQGYSYYWSDNVTGLVGPVSQDNQYTYIVGVFKAEKTGEHQVAIKVTREHQWVGEASMQITVDEY
ncbi:hypothetical protein [Brevibacillus choshinensis]|uniref:Copper amine oxidase n=1 Tax=Brevibacillus choshinensis TaxID=54911 RepID=A0ABX7FSB7_BRECH|nr:hypothetical protein [Brevibacillus choshinensis]QRG69139.1 hypothetical protein JNE38_08400 [Brevibacillus choshinensis]